jgi:hypothetical protein
MKNLLIFLALYANLALAYSDYEVVLPLQSDQALGPTGLAGDTLDRLVIIPLSVTCGDVHVKDGSSTAVRVFRKGTLSNLTPIVIEMGSRSVSGGWKVSTQDDVQVFAVGRFR